MSFWTQLFEKAKTRTKLHARISPNYYNWVGTSSGIRGLNWNYCVRQHTTLVELYIDRGEADENRAIFDELFALKPDVEASFGEALDWQQLEGKRACRIRPGRARGATTAKRRFLLKAATSNLGLVLRQRLGCALGL